MPKETDKIIEPINASLDKVSSTIVKASETKKILKASHYGSLKIGDLEIKCAVLEDGTRLINQASIFKAFGRPQRGSRQSDKEINLPSFIAAKNLKPFVNQELEYLIKQVEYIVPTGKITKAYRAELLPAICELYLIAKDEGNVLIKSQLPLASQAEILIRAFAKTGIVALVDEATGYQYVRSPDALRLLIEQYIERDKQQWLKEFRDDYYVELHRLYKTGATNIQNRPKYFAGFTLKYVYTPMESGKVLEELDKINPVQLNGNRKARLHQHLSEEYGKKKLRDKIMEVITLMKISPNIRKFKSNYAKANPTPNQQFEFELEPD